MSTGRNTASLQPIPFVWDTLQRLAVPGGTVVDVGCGASLYRGAVDGKYIGVDITDEPYRAGVPRDVDVVAPADAIPLADASADLLFSVAAFLLMEDPRRVLAEFRRVLRPGGRLVIFDYNRRMRRELAAKHGTPHPAWTQWRLRREVQQAGFHEARLLVPVGHDARGLPRLVRLVLQELLGQWAIVSATR